MQIGPYAVGASILDYPNIRKLSWWKSFDIKRPKVRGLKLYASSERSDIFDGGHEIIVGVAAGLVFSLSVLFAFRSEDSMGDKLVQVVEHYRGLLGEHTSDKTYPIRWLTGFVDVAINVEHVTGVADKLCCFTLTVSAI
jgi:hypothetical protein